MKKILGILVLTFFLFPTSLNSEINEKKAEKTKLWTKCKPEKGVEVQFKNDDNNLSTEELDNLLTGNTLVSVDRWGTFAIYYPSNKDTVGWMPKEHLKGKQDWTKGTVTFENNKYCRQWVDWGSGKKINCWNAYEGEKRVDMRSFYFVCRNGVPDGDQHIVFPGNLFNIKYTGSGKSTGKLTQDNEKVKIIWEKYFSEYVK